MAKRAEPSGRRLSEADAALVKSMAARGDRHHDIAAWFGVNQGRIAEVQSGDKHPNIPPAPLEELPPPGPYSSGQAAYIAVKALENAKSVFENALKDVDAALKDIKRAK